MKNLQATKGKKLAMTLNIDVRMVQMFLEIRQNLRISATRKLPSDRAMYDRSSRLTVQEILKEGEYCAIA
jgi:hypothetical protein